MQTNPEQTAGFLSRITFWYLQPLLKLGFERPLELDDLYDLNHKDRADFISNQFSLAWKRELNSAKPSLLKALHRTFGTRLYLAAIPKFVYDVLLFVGPLIVYAMVDFVQDKNTPISVGFGYIFLFFFTSVLQSLLLHNYFKIGFNVAINVRTAVATTVYDKALHLTNAARQTKTVGEIVNLMSVDARRIQDIIPYVHLVWSSPLQIIIGFSMLAKQMGIGPTFAGVVVLALTIPLNGLLTHYQSRWEDKVMKSKDARVKAVAEALQAVRVIKFFSWESSMLAKINQLRKNEMDYLTKVKYVTASSDFFWTVTPSLVTVATFIPYLLLGHSLSSAQIYSVLTILNVMRFPMNALPFVISGAISAAVSKKRVEQFLLSEELDQFYGNIVSKVQPARRTKKKKVRFSDRVSLLEEEEEADEASEEEEQKESEEKDDAVLLLPPLSPLTPSKEGDKSVGKEVGRVVVRVSQGDFAWGSAQAEQPVLTGINLEVRAGEFVVVVGPVGSGKSSLLAAILNEMHKINGKVELNESVAYVAQTAWIINATLKDNILLGSQLNESKYQETLRVCALLPDLQVLPGGDQCEIGEKGINLSGGQKQRVALARAVYKEMDTYLLDDPLSAVDSGVGHHLLHECILTQLANRTRILVTHQLYPLSHADKIVVMQSGKISAVGTYDELVRAGYDFATYVHTTHSTQKTETKTKEDDTKKAKLVTVEERNTGSVRFSYYKNYFQNVGYMWILWIVILGIIGSGVRVANDWWVAQTNEDRKVYFATYLSLSTLLAALFFVQAFLAALGGLKAATSFHDTVLARVFRAPVSFFDSTPLGRVLNRFSRDLDTLDSSLPSSMFDLLGCILPIITTIGLLIVVSPFFIVFVFPIGFLYRKVERYFIASSRELQRLDNISISPVYSHFTETINGVTTIRAYKMIERYKQLNNEKIDKNNYATFPAMLLNRWLSIRLEFCGTCIVVASAFLIVVTRNLMHITPALAGLALSYSLSVTGALSWMVRVRTDTETKMNSVERMQEYKILPQEGAAEGTVVVQPHDTWPSQGQIIIKNLQLRYRDDLELVLRGISCNISPGQKIGVCGRTGSGKSSLMQALFRIVEPCGGTIEIDGMNTAQVPLDRLRDGMAIIPQDPVLFEGTFRSNLDPFEKYSDAELIRVLERVKLDGLIRNEKGLAGRIAEGGESMSVGERQLLCLARALLKRARVVVLDEATAAVDHRTDEFIQQTIRNECANATIITIAHRLNTLQDYDMILVLDHGAIVQMGPPSEVLHFAKDVLVDESQPIEEEKVNVL